MKKNVDWAKLFRTMYTIRVFEKRCIKLYRQGQILGYFHPYLGEEAIAAGVSSALDEGDYVVSTHRGHGHCIAHRGDLNQMLAELLGKASGYCGGRGGSMHIADFARGNLGANGIVGGGLPMAVGAALGAKIRGENRVAVVFFSDGAANNGVFCESLNLAAIWDLGVLFVLENNQYAVSSPIETMTRNPELHVRGSAYGVDSVRVDGNDVRAVLDAATEGVAACREGKGPVLIEAVTYRHTGHHVNDPGKYMPEDKVEYYRSRDPIDICAQYVVDLGDGSPEQVASIKKEVESRVEEAVEFALNAPPPSPEEFIQCVGAQA